MVEDQSYTARKFLAKADCFMYKKKYFCHCKMSNLYLQIPEFKMFLNVNSTNEKGLKDLIKFMN
jgi:hypothetical protein